MNKQPTSSSDGTPCPPLTTAQIRLLKLCAAHVEKRMWLPAQLKRDRQVALRLADKSMIARTSVLEGAYELTERGAEYLSNAESIRGRN